jgi:hypothetical protein
MAKKKIYKEVLYSSVPNGVQFYVAPSNRWFTRDSSQDQPWIGTRSYWQNPRVYGKRKTKGLKAALDWYQNAPDYLRKERVKLAVERKSFVVFVEETEETAGLESIATMLSFSEDDLWV